MNHLGTNRWLVIVMITLIASFFLWGGIASAPTGIWLRGDLHSHSLYSDGDSSVADIIASAESEGLDFFSLTDHDSFLDGVPSHWDDPDYASDRMILLYGMEWTTVKGHANVWAAAPFDYSKIWQANQNVNPMAALSAARESHALFSINHPFRNRWKYPVPSGIHAIEIWNGPMLVNNNARATHKFWDSVLLKGYQVTGVGGSDTHDLKGLTAPFTGHGYPSIWVYAKSKDASSVIEAIEMGRVTMSCSGDAPRLEFAADTDGNGGFETLMGDTVAGSGHPIDFRILLVGDIKGPARLIEVPEDMVRRLKERKLSFKDYFWLIFAFHYLDDSDIQFLSVIKNGTLFKAYLMTQGVDSVFFIDTPSIKDRSFYRTELYGDTKVDDLKKLVFGLRIAASNPIYVNY